MKCEVCGLSGKYNQWYLEYDNLESIRFLHSMFYLCEEHDNEKYHDIIDKVNVIYEKQIETLQTRIQGLEIEAFKTVRVALSGEKLRTDGEILNEMSK